MCDLECGSAKNAWALDVLQGKMRTKCIINCKTIVPTKCNLLLVNKLKLTCLEQGGVYKVCI